VEDELDAPAAEHTHLRGRGQPVVELDPGSKAAQHLRVRLALELRLVHLLDLVARVRQPVGELPVVRQQERPGRVDVEPPDRHHPSALARDEIDHGAPPFRVARRRHNARRLVEEDVRERLPGDLLPVERHDVVRADDGVEPARHAVHGDSSRLDEVVGLAARRDARAGQECVQPHGAIISRARVPEAAR
jgi:hypothetical protein